MRLLVTFFIYEVSGEVMVKFHQKPDLYRKVDLPEMLIQQSVEFPTVVTHKSLTIWSHLMDHWKADRVVYRNSIQDF
jgi:hypothetical protein